MTQRFTARWDIRTGSPRKTWRALHDLLDDLVPVCSQGGVIKGGKDSATDLAHIPGRAALLPLGDRRPGELEEDHPMPANHWRAGVVHCLAGQGRRVVQQEPGDVDAGVDPPIHEGAGVREHPGIRAGNAERQQGGSGKNT